MVAEELVKCRLKFTFPEHPHFLGPAPDTLLCVRFTVPRRIGKSFLLRVVAEVFA